MKPGLGKPLLVLILAVVGVLAAPVAADYGGTYDVTLSDTGPTFYDHATAGFSYWSYDFEMHGSLSSYSTASYSGSGWDYMEFLIYGLYSLDYASVRLSNSQGFSYSATYHQGSFTGSTYYPFLSDDQGGPTSTLWMKWHYVFVAGPTY